MSKQVRARLSDKSKTMIVAAMAVLLVLANIVPLRYSHTRDCPHGGQYTTKGVTFGVPLSYAGTAHSGINDCAAFDSESSGSGFSAQALIADVAVFGLVMIGLNVLLDRRTK